MTKTLLPILVLLSVLAPAEETRPVSTNEVKKILFDSYLLHEEGGALWIPAFAERLEKENGFSRAAMCDLLLEIAACDDHIPYARANALVAFLDIAPKTEYGRIDSFYSSPVPSLRWQLLSQMLRKPPTLAEKLAYTHERFAWMKDHPELQSDLFIFGSYFAGFMYYPAFHATEQDRADVIAFFREEAANASCFAAAYEADMLLVRDDPAWKTNEARRAMMEKWKDDPNIHENTRARWEAALAKFDGTNVAVQAAPDQPKPISPSNTILVRSDSERSPADDEPNDGRSDLCETDSTTEDSEPIAPSEDNLPTGLPGSRLAIIAGAVPLLAIAFALAVRRQHHRSGINEGQQPAE